MLLASGRVESTVCKERGSVITFPCPDIDACELLSLWPTQWITTDPRLPFLAQGKCQRPCPVGPAAQYLLWEVHGRLNRTEE
jgi:hypothetical protein